MAKVMISLPDELLARVDAEAAEAGLSRSALIRRYTNAALGERSQRLADVMEELNAESRRGHGGDVAAVLEASRPS